MLYLGLYKEGGATLTLIATEAEAAMLCRAPGAVSGELKWQCFAGKAHSLKILSGTCAGWAWVCLAIPMASSIAETKHRIVVSIVAHQASLGACRRNVRDDGLADA